MDFKPETESNPEYDVKNGNSASVIVESNASGVSFTSSGAEGISSAQFLKKSAQVTKRNPECTSNVPQCTSENGVDKAETVETNTSDASSTISDAKECSYEEFRTFIAEKFPGQSLSEYFMRDYINVLSNQRDFYIMQERNLEKTIDHLKNSTRGPQDFERLLLIARQIEFSKKLLNKVRECIPENESRIERIKLQLSKPPEERWLDVAGTNEVNTSDLECSENEELEVLEKAVAMGLSLKDKTG